MISCSISRFSIKVSRHHVAMVETPLMDNIEYSSFSVGENLKGSEVSETNK
jgi:hypothetical protein